MLGAGFYKERDIRIINWSFDPTLVLYSRMLDTIVNEINRLENSFIRKIFKGWKSKRLVNLERDRSYYECAIECRIEDLEDSGIKVNRFDSATGKRI